jgi:hypothetical protein
MMRALATACLLALSQFAMADPFVVSDPVADGVTQCGVYIDTAARVTSPVVAATGGNICKYDLAGLSVGPHLVTMTAIAVNDPIWGSQESAHSSPLAFEVQAPVAMNYQGLWWVIGGTESGWGINFSHQGNTIFASWFTYDHTGKAWWLVMTAPKTGPDVYTGQLFRTTGPAFNAVPFDPALVVATPVGIATLSFADVNNGGFDYRVNGIRQIKTITRQVFGPLPTCVFGAQSNLALATNYQDLWWAASEMESGWGINFTHQGDSVFATWYTYDVDGTPLWLSASTQRVGLSNVFTGSLLRTSGPRFDEYKTSDLNSPQDVGMATLTFANGNSATFNYVTNGSGGLPAVNQTKSITRFLFTATGGTVCQ